MITAIYAGLLGLIYFRLSLETIFARQKNQISIGSGKEDQIAQIVAAHSNFSAYAPLLLILMALAEYIGKVPLWTLHLYGVLITLGRLLHFLAFRGKMNFPMRKVGMHMTLWPLLLMSLALVVLGIKGQF